MSQKKYLRLRGVAAAALLAATGAASAQSSSSVQIYGLLDVSVGSFKVSGQPRTKDVISGRMSTSYIGFRATEDLGAGLRAIATLESFVRVDTGQNSRFNGDSFWSRESSVGLAGGFGMLRLGRVGTPLFINTVVFNPFGGSFGYSPAIRTVFQGGIGKVAGDTAWNNSIDYDSPDFGGLRFSVQYALREGAGSGADSSVGAMYRSGPLALGLAVQRVQTAFVSDDETTWQLGGSYDFGAAKVFGQYGRSDEGNTGTTAANTRDRLMQFGVSVPVGGNGSVLASYGEAKTSGNLDSKRSFTSLGYDYRLSKRTDIYGVVMFDKLKGFDRASTTAVGVKHTF